MAKIKLLQKLRYIREVFDAKSIVKRQTAKRILQKQRNYKNLFVLGDIGTSDSTESGSDYDDEFTGIA